MTIRIQYARCWECGVSGGCYTEPTPHTWMDAEDAECKGLAWPMTQEQKEAHPCACTCANGPGVCVVIGDGGNSDG